MNVHLVIGAPSFMSRFARPPERGMRMIHLEHPERPGEAWCGTTVVGLRGQWQFDCVVCAGLYEDDYRRSRS